MSEILKENSKAGGGPVKKTKRTSSKSSSSKSGLSAKEELEMLNSSISLAKGLLATLSTNDPSAWMRKCHTKAAQEHTRILLQEVMEEIGNADLILAKMMTNPQPRLIY